MVALNMNKAFYGLPSQVAFPTLPVRKFDTMLGIRSYLPDYELIGALGQILE